jgi:uncharacterized protein (DUF1697 family)
MAQARYVVLLRAVNVGGTGKVSMPRLRELLAEAGLEDVATYVQSGNVVVSPGTVHGGAEEVGDAVHNAIRDGFGLNVPVVVRTGAQIAKVVAANPFPDAEPTRVGVLFASRSLTKAEIDQLAGRAAASEDVARAAGHVFINCPDGFGRSKLASAAGAPRGELVVTMRNMRTVTRLAEMAEGPR